MHEAEASLHLEIQSNAQGAAGLSRDIHNEQRSLQHDVDVLDQIIKTGKPPKHTSIQAYKHIDRLPSQHIRQRKLADCAGNRRTLLHALQDHTEEVAVRNSILSLAPLTDQSFRRAPTFTEASGIKQHIDILQGRLLLLDALVKSLDSEYKQFLKANP